VKILLADEKPDAKVGGGLKVAKQAVEHTTDTGRVRELCELHV
jgi:hypothetical protein